MQLNKTYYYLFVSYFILFSIIFYVLIPFYFGSEFLPGDPSEYSSTIINNINISLLAFLNISKSQLIMVPYFVAYKYFGSFGFVLINTFLISLVHIALYRFLIKSGFYYSFRRFSLIFILCLLPMIFWYSQVSKEVFSLYSVIFFIIYSNYCFNNKLPFYNPTLKSFLILFTSIFICFFSRSYLMVFLLLYFFLLTWRVGFLRLFFKTKYILFLSFCLICIFLTSELIFSAAYFERISLDIHDKFRTDNFGSFGFSEVINYCLIDLTRLSQVPLISDLFKNRCYSYILMNSQESHVIDLMFAPYRPFQDQSLFVNLLSVLYDGFLGFFSPSPFLLFYILLNGFSITVLLMLPVKIFFLISFLRSLISIFSSHKKNVASIIRPLFYTIFLTLLIFSISEAHYGTLFRYTFPFQVIFIFIFLRRCRGNAL